MKPTAIRLAVGGIMIPAFSTYIDIYRLVGPEERVSHDVLRSGNFVDVRPGVSDRLIKIYQVGNCNLSVSSGYSIGPQGFASSQTS